MGSPQGRRCRTICRSRTSQPSDRGVEKSAQRLNRSADQLRPLTFSRMPNCRHVRYPTAFPSKPDIVVGSWDVAWGPEAATPITELSVDRILCAAQSGYGEDCNGSVAVK